MLGINNLVEDDNNLSERYGHTFRPSEVQYRDDGVDLSLYQSRQALIPRAIQLNAGANIESPHQSVQITPQVTSIALGQDTTNASSTTIGPLAISALPVPSNNSQLLASKWLSTKDLKQLENEGLVYKKGKFSLVEDDQIKAAVLDYRNTQNLTDEEIKKLIFQKHKKNGLFWSKITQAVPQRTVMAVYKHVHRMYDPSKQQGKWTTYEDSILLQAVGDLGRAWQNVSKRVGRAGDDCRDRYRYLADHKHCNSGPWSEEEENNLRDTVLNIPGVSASTDASTISWGHISQQMGNTRSAKQCKEKWIDSLSLLIKTKGERPIWNVHDTYMLIQKVGSLAALDPADIQWDTLLDETWNYWSGHLLQKRWAFLKNTVPNSESMTHPEIVDYLRSLYPETSAANRKFRQAKNNFASSQIITTQIESQGQA